MDIKKTEVELLIEKAAAALDSSDAQRFSQAACNAANALITVANTQIIVNKNQ